MFRHRAVALIAGLSVALSILLVASPPTRAMPSDVRPNNLDIRFTEKGQAVDRSPFEAKAQVFGATAATGPDGPALQFGKQGDAVMIDGARGLGGLDQFLIDAWVRPDELEAAHPIIATDQFVLRLSAGKLEGLIRGERGAWQSISAAGPLLAAGNWYHVAMSYDGKRADLFLNGAPVASRAIAAAKAPDSLSASLGYEKGMQFVGAINRVRVRHIPADRSGLLLDLQLDSGVQTPGSIWDDSGWAQPIEGREIKFDGGAYFGGQTSYMKTLPDLINGNLQEFAIDVSFQTRVTQGRQNLVESSNYSLFLDGDTLVASILSSDGVWQDATRAKTQVGAETRAFLTYDGDTADLYLNGKLAASNRLGKPLAPSERPEIVIGTHPGLRWWFNGKMNWVRIYRTGQAGGPPVADLTFDDGMYESFQGRDVSPTAGFQLESQALAFNGKSSTVLADLSQGTGETFSAEAWINPAALGGRQAIIVQGGFGFYLNENRLLATTRGRTGGSSTLESKQTLPKDGKWHHVLFTLQQGTGSLALDGNADASGQMLQPMGGEQASIGSDGARTAFFRGSIDNVRLWPGVLRPVLWFTDLRIQQVELTQAIQTATNTVKLTYGKKTAARVFVKTPASPIGSVRVKVYAYQSGVQLAGSPQTFAYNWDANASAWVPYTAKPSPKREQTFDALNINLPTNWVNPPSHTAAVSLYFEVNPTHTIHEWNYANNWHFASMRLYDVPTLYVKEVPLRIVKGGSTYATSYANFAAAVPFMRRTYPVATPNGVTLVPGPTLTVNANPATQAGWNSVWSAVTAAYHLDLLHPYYYWYGMIPQAAGGYYYGMGWQPGYTSIGMSGPLTPDYYGRDTTMAHEIGHNHGRPHASFDHGEGGSGSAWPYPHGGIGDVGFDTQFMRALPPGNPAGTHFHDFMAYGYPRWVSIKGWNDLMLARQARPNPKWLLGPHLILTGFIRPDGGVEMHQVYQADTPQIAQEQFDSPYAVQVLDSAGKVIATRKINLVEGVHADGGHGEYEGFTFAESVPVTEGKPAAFRILKDGQQILRRDATASGPVLSELAVKATRDGHYQVSWKAADADSQDLTFALLYASGGANWTPIANGLTAAGFDFDATTAAGSEAARIRVLASDGFNTTLIDSAPFAVAYKPPTIFIDAPAAMTAGQALAAYATVTDPQDGTIAESALTWLVDGAKAAQGSELSLSTLTPGKHTLTLTATNSRGLTAKADAAILVDRADIREQPIATLIEMQIDNPEASVNKITVYLDQPPVIVQDRTLVPIRFIAEGMGAQVEWNGQTRQVTLTTETDVILLTIDSHDAYVNGQYKYLDVPPQIMNSRTMLPVRFVSENLGAEVQWDGVARRVTVVK